MTIPGLVQAAWTEREGPLVLATVDQENRPNIIYATCAALYGGKRLVVADNYFDKTRANIKAGCRGAALFITNSKKAYQLKGTFEYHTDGPIFEHMKQWNPAKHPGHAAVALVVEEIYSGAKKIIPESA